MSQTIQTVIIGAGHAGLCMSRALQKAGIDHVVLERGRIGQTWRAQRWDAFRLNTPNWTTLLIDEELSAQSGDRADFSDADTFVERLRTYAERFELPVREETPVESVEREGDRFVVRTASGTWTADNLVVASGALNRPKTPAIGAELPGDIEQLHSARYRSADELPDGAVLVVGAAQSGTQIAEDLAQSGREVHLCTSRVGRALRRYRGRDVMEWMWETPMVRQTVADLPDPAMQYAAQPLIGPGHTMTLQQLGRLGVNLLGRLEAVDGSRLIIGDQLAEHVAFADQGATQMKGMLDTVIDAMAPDTEPATPDAAEAPFAPIDEMSRVRELDLEAAGVRTVIWATGYAGSYDFLEFDIGIDAHGVPAHDEGASPIAGLYFLGIPWQRTRISGLIAGAVGDAAHVAEHICARTPKAAAGQPDLQQRQV